jgi:isopentenyldiphosphate isomerase
MTPAQDPNELFDVVTVAGEPIGVRKARAAVHRDGDWHRAIHVWLVSGTGRDGSIIFQQRCADKDTYPGLLDASVGGHLCAGESIWDAMRETQEEIGLSLSAIDVELVGRRYAVSDNGTVRDYEIQDVFFANVNDPIAVCRPNPAEVDALVMVRIGDVMPVLSGQESWCWADYLLPDASRERRKLTRECFVPIKDRYYLRVALAARAWLSGADFVAV